MQIESIIWIYVDRTTHFEEELEQNVEVENLFCLFN